MPQQNPEVIKPKVVPEDAEPKSWVPAPSGELGGRGGGGEEEVNWRMGDFPDDPDDPGTGGGGGGGGGSDDDDCCSQAKDKVTSFFIKVMVSQLASDTPEDEIKEHIMNKVHRITGTNCEKLMEDLGLMSQISPEIQEILQDWIGCQESKDAGFDPLHPDAGWSGTESDESTMFSDEFTDKYASSDEPIDVAWGLLKMYRWLDW